MSAPSDYCDVNLPDLCIKISVLEERNCEITQHISELCDSIIEQKGEIYTLELDDRNEDEEEQRVQLQYGIVENRESVGELKIQLLENDQEIKTIWNYYKKIDGPDMERP